MHPSLNGAAFRGERPFVLEPNTPLPPLKRQRSQHELFVLTLVNSSRQILHALFEHGMNEIRNDLGERSNYEISLCYLRMRKCERRGLEHRITDKEKVEIDRARLPPFVRRAVSSEFSFDAEQLLQDAFG